MADGADEAVVVARDALQRAAEQRVGLPGAVGVGGDDRVDAVAGAQQRLEALVVKGSPKCMKRPPLQVPRAVWLGCIAKKGTLRWTPIPPDRPPMVTR